MNEVRSIKKTSSQSIVNSGQNGQGTIEYVLLLVVTVALVLSLVAQFSKPFQDYVGNAMGTYITCLLETGELPGMGASEAGEALCRAPEFGPGGASPANASNSGAGGGNASGSGADGEGSDGSGSGANGGSSADGSSGGGGGTGYAGSAGRKGSGRSFIRNFKSNSAGGQGGSGNKSEVIDEDSSASGSLFSSRGSSYYRNRQKRKAPQYSAVRGNISEADIKKNRRTAELKKRAVAQDSTGVTVSKKIILKPQEAKKSKVGEGEEPWSIGNFLKYLIIAAIIIALVVFIGGQALSLSSD